MTQTLKSLINEKDGYVILKISGDLSEAQVEGFKKEALEASELISNYSKKSNKKIRTLLDVSDFTGKYCPETITLLVDFAKRNKSYIEKSASFGGSYKVNMTGEATMTLSDREDIQIFDTEKEAKLWLLS